MSNGLAGKVAFISGAARGQGRSHAVRLAADGADIIALDICDSVESVGYPMATKADLDETVRLVRAEGRQIVAGVADVRSQDAVDSVVGHGLAELGHVDIVCANAGLTTYGKTWLLTDDEWQTIIDVNLTGVWHTVKAAIPSMIEAGSGGSIVITSSAGGRKGITNAAHYVSTKHGVVGLMRTLANELAPYRIRVNTIHPCAVDTPLIHNEVTYRLFLPDVASPTREDAERPFLDHNPLGVPWLQPIDVSNAVAWLVSDAALYVTGSEIPVDAGFHNRV
jgi:SDR family mycofactocin-dependent oxidoreductase